MRQRSRQLARVLTQLAFILLIGPAASAVLTAQAGEFDDPQPSAGHHPLMSLDLVPRVRTVALDRAFLHVEDFVREQEGLPPRFAVPQLVDLSPDNCGTLWEAIDKERFLVWRLRITSPDALSLNLGFSDFHLPKGGHLWVYAADLKGDRRHFTDANNQPHGELWTPVVVSNDIIVELTVPT